MSVDVPKWKKDLILKKQQWKSQGGWSVPPHPICTSPRAVKPNVRPPQNVSAIKTLNTDTPQNGPFCKLSDSPKKRPISAPKCDLDSAEGEIFGSVSDLRAIFQPKGDFPAMTKSRSVENILDETPISNNSRRASTDFAQTPKLGSKKFRAVPSMEDFFKKYRKVVPKKIPVVLDLPKSAQPDKIGRKDKTVYFVDMKKNELPSPNIVKETVKVFEYPQNPNENNFEKSAVASEDNIITVKTRDVVQQFEAKIKSRPDENMKPKKPLKIDIPRTEKRTDFIPSDFIGDFTPTAHEFDKNGNSGPNIEFSTSPKVFNVVLSSDSTVVAGGLNSPTDEKMSDLKTVTINTNQSIIIKTI